MLSVSIINVLRQLALPGTDFGRPGEVLNRLNAMFQMENHNGMFFTIWYGRLHRPGPFAGLTRRVDITALSGVSPEPQGFHPVPRRFGDRSSALQE